MEFTPSILICVCTIRFANVIIMERTASGMPIRKIAFAIPGSMVILLSSSL